MEKQSTVLCTAPETCDESTNQQIQARVAPMAHPLDEEAETAVPSGPLHPVQSAHQIKKHSTKLPPVSPSFHLHSTNWYRPLSDEYISSNTHHTLAHSVGAPFLPTVVLILV